MNEMNYENAVTALGCELRRRVLLLDGATGVMLRRRCPASNLDMLCLTHPDIVADVHREYLEAGADIIETNSFNANALSQRAAGASHPVRDLNLAAARIARGEADRFSAIDGHRPRFVAGSIGPTAFSASHASEQGGQSFDSLVEAFSEQAAALVEGEVDMLLIETVYDALNARAAALGAVEAFERTSRAVPLFFSATVSDASGRLPSGHTVDEFLDMVAEFSPLAVGFNCSAGPSGLFDVMRHLAGISPFATIYYPNAGLPGADGTYPFDPARFVTELTPLLTDRILNIAGGCCGTTPAHIAALRRLLDRPDVLPREITDQRLHIRI